MGLDFFSLHGLFFRSTDAQVFLSGRGEEKFPINTIVTPLPTVFIPETGLKQ